MAANGLNGFYMEDDPELEAEKEMRGDGDNSLNDQFNELHASEEITQVPNFSGRVAKKSKKGVLKMTSPLKNDSNGVASARLRHGSTGSTGSNGSLSPPVNNVSLSQKVILSRNSKKSRQGKGRGLAKKGGAGGKGTWGAPGCELVEEEVDEGDPNYDSDSQDGVVMQKLMPPLTDEQFESTLHEVLAEYYLSSDAAEVVRSLRSLNLGGHRNKVARSAVSLALDRKAAEREMTSRLLSDLYGPVLQQNDIAGGFDLLLEELPDLTIDTPDAPDVIGMFLARAVADDCLPPAFVQQHKGKAESSQAIGALEKAHVLLSMKHGIVRLDSIWGVGGGIRPVKALVKKMVLLLQEYLSSADVEEATRCLKELQVPHFHHELVYQSLLLVIEDSGERAVRLIAELLCSLVKAVIVPTDQLSKGLERVYAELPELKLDVPNAYSMMERFAGVAQKLQFIPKTLLEDLPTGGRKRFASEGDGGLIKHS